MAPDALTGEILSTVKEGDRAPNFSAKIDSGKEVRLSDFKNRKVILYFYPKDDTPGCIKEACSFRDDIRTLASKGAVVIGVSPDSTESHRKFKKKHGLNFSLLSDPGKEICKSYGVWKKKSFMGREFMGVERTTFIISEKGVIDKIFHKVNPVGHSKEILEFLGSP
ncbi:MAG: thioredoxin-dependent thiol peroxidase [Candidatus Aenigmarchaeota archaeon]|nr:thioredoxin-dependent thiol peroxidase [Candidatus Aenigmarchaeota archaeon]